MENYEKEEWGGWKIISDMLDNPDKNGIYPTSEAYKKLYEFVIEQKTKEIMRFMEKIQEKANNMHETIENIIKKNLPEKVDDDGFAQDPSVAFNNGFDEALSQINPSKIADEVLKVVVEEIYKKMDEYEYHKDEIHCTCLGALREFLKESTNSNTLEGERSEHLSPNKENKNNANPKYKIGEVVFVKSELDDEKICQGVIKSADTTIDGRTWFYEIYIPLMPSDTKGETIYSYEEDTGDAKKRFIN